MIIKFSNLGNIKETELDLRPLTIIIGPNNSNKTYIAYSLYGIWQSLRTFDPFGASFILNRAGDNLLSVKANDRLIKVLTDESMKRINGFKSSLETFFQDSSGKLFSKTSFNLQIFPEDIIKALHDVAAQKTIEGFHGEQYVVRFKDNVLFIGLDRGRSQLNETEISNIYAEWALNTALMRSLFSEPFLLPAERNAFILTYKLLANRRYKYLRQSRRELFWDGGDKQRQLELFKEQGDIGYPQPIEDFWDFLTDIEFQSNDKINSHKKTEFYQLANQIEHEIQNNNKTNLKPTKLGGKEIKVEIKRGLSIDLYNASSSIKQLAPLLLYLRYRASKNDLLIIDEPEMNLHPESQAKLLEVLAILINLGVKVLLTTHSPYFMAHLNNLVVKKAKNRNIRLSQASLLYLRDERAFLNDDQVGAYEMDITNYKLRPLKDKDYGIKWDTLSDVSADLQQKYFQIYEKGKTSSSAKKKSKPRKKSAA